MSWRIDIRVEQHGLGDFKAIDDQTYDADIDGECCPVGHGTTKWEAIEDLLANYKEAETREMFRAAHAEGEMYYNTGSHSTPRSE